MLYHHGKHRMGGWIFLLICINTATKVATFEFPKIPTLTWPSANKDASLLPFPNTKAQQTKKLLFEAVSGTDNGKSATPEQQAKVLEIVRNLESMAPPSIEKILVDPKEATKIDGVWYLQYTSPSNLETQGTKDQFPDAWKPVNAKEGKSRINTRPFKEGKGAVEASIVKVDTANRVVQQIFDVKESRVQNKIDLGWGRVKVEGNFRASETVPNRAIVSFDQAEIVLNNGFVLDLGWYFDLVPFFQGGSRDSGWIETTYIDEELRIARGNKGTMFVITRSPELVTP